MATRNLSTSEPTIEKMLVRNFSRLWSAVRPNIIQVAVEAYSGELIGGESLSKAVNCNTNDHQRASELLRAIMSSIKENDAHFNTFVTIIRNVNFNKLADELMKAAAVSPENSTQSGNSGNIAGPLQPVASRFKCPCGHCSIEVYFGDKSKCPKFAEGIFPFLQVGLNEDEKEILEHQLIRETEQIIGEFKKLLNVVFKLLQAKKTLVQDIRATVFSSAMESKVIQTAHGSELRTITTVSDIQCFLIQYRYISFINYGIIEEIVDKHCKECQNDVDTYLQKFREFSKRNIFEIPSDVLSSSSSSDQLLVVKVIDEMWFGAERDTSHSLFTLNDIKSIENKIAKVIGHNNRFIHLVDIGKGCLQLAFTIWPCHQTFSPQFTAPQLSELIQHGIIVLHQPNVQSLPSYTHGQMSTESTVHFTSLTEDKIDDALREITQRSKDVSAQKEAIKAHISKRIEKLHQALDERKDELMKQLHLITQNKQKCLQDQQEELQALRTQVEWDEVIFMKAEGLKPRVDADLKFVVTTTTNIRSLCGELFSTIPGKCKSKLTPEEFSTTKKENVAMLEITDFDDQPIIVDSTAISCELVSGIANEKSSVTVTPIQEEVGRYKLKYTPTIKGRHKLHVKVNDQEVKESPFTIKVKASNHLKSLGQPINDTKYDRIWTPHGIMLSQNNEVVVTHWQDNCVSVISPGEDTPYSFDNHVLPGKKIPHLFTKNKSNSEGEFNRPHQIAQDRDGKYYVTDFFNGRVQKFSENWKFEKSSEGSIHLFNPAGIAYNPINGRLYVVEEENPKHSIQVLDTELARVKSFGTTGSRECELRKPWGIAIQSSTGNVYVTDLMNKRIQVFTADGNHICEIGKHELRNPVGIAIDSDGHIFVSESGEGYRIAVFDLQGHFLREFGGEGDRQEAVGSESPNKRYRGIAVDDCGVVYVCDETGNCVLLF